MPNSFFRFKRFSIAVMLGLFVFLNIVGVLSSPAPAQAGFPVSVIGDITLTTFKLKDEIIDNIKSALLNAASVAVSYVLKKVAYDSAVWLASGGKGQGALAFTNNFGDYLKNVASDAVGQGVELLGTKAGFSLCKVPNLQVDLKIRESVRLGLDPSPEGDPTRKPECNFTEFIANWSNGDAWKSQFSSLQASVQEQFTQSIRVDQTGLGYRLAAMDKISDLIAKKKEGEAKQREEGQGGAKAKAGLVDGTIKTPAGVIQQEFNDNTNTKNTQKQEDQISTAISSGDFRLLPGALGRFFLGTLAGTLLKNFQEKGVLPFGICIGGYGGADCQKVASVAANSFAEAGVLGGRRAAEQLFSDFLAVQTSAVDQYNILAQLSSCPETPGPYNCRADEGLVQAAQAYGDGQPVTIKEALDKGWLHRSWKLLPASREAENSIESSCYRDAYCYANIKVLRQLRILSIGFQLAVERSDPDNPVTLGKVVDDFNKCTPVKDNSGQATGAVVFDEKNPYCHLIDPNWVIKVFPTRCNALSYGASLFSPDVPDRMQECVDLSTCVAFNADGSCANYGYCTREQNSWKFVADSCEPQNRTCQTFTNDQGQQKSYLYRTLDTGSCTQDNVGCRLYSFTKNNQGQWQSPTGPSMTREYTNDGGYFTGAINAACSAQSAGCSAFKLATTIGSTPEGTPVYLKKAPDYLKCYDADRSTSQIDWPKTRADLARLQISSECSQYAGVCIPEETSCSWYTPVSRGGDRVPGRFTPAEIKDGQLVWNDQCDQRCVGYAAYQEVPSNYSNGDPLSYIIPSSGQACTQQDAGCSSFTNLSTATGGVENVEHYSYLRSCAQPDRDPGKNFITYEGSAQSGYQLKVFTLVADTTGAPKYFYRTPEELTQFNASCNETLYQAGTADPDCRQFNDDVGRVYYRLLLRTVVVSKACTPYRLNATELFPSTLDQTACTAQKGFWNGSSCQLCFQGGEYKDGLCFYYGLPGGEESLAGSSQTCSAAVNSCRAYKGNAGNNVRDIFNDDFENSSASTALTGWQPATISVALESTRLGQHSLGYAGNGQVYKELTLTPGNSYDLNFWVKGSGQSVRVMLASADNSFTRDFGTVSVADAWKVFHLGPVQLGGSSANARLIFQNLSVGNLFLDHVQLSEVTQQLYLVKNSLKVDAVCDSTPEDNLPGEALGCTDYKNLNNQSVYLTNFSYLCREGAVGCTAITNSYNTPNDPGPQAYNVKLSGASGSVPQVTIKGIKYSCQIPVGSTSCNVSVSGASANEITAAAGAGSFTKSTQYIPSDTPTSTPLYLVANQAAVCTATDLGCQYAGAQIDTPSGPTFVTTTIKNDPALYTKALCQEEAVGCRAYSSAGGNVYFKDPEVTGKKICAYQTGVAINGQTSSGWFWKDTGVCSQNPRQYCTANADCGSGNTCRNIGTQPCYADYRQLNNNYGLWSYGDVGKYANFVGECPAQQSSCTEFVDHNDNDRQYYFIKNQKVSSEDCAGGVSQKEGCALFDQTDNPNKFWSTAASYQASEQKNNDRVQPIDGTATRPADANIIIKVARDRMCGEWLQCRSSHRVWDEKNAKWKVICDDIGRCNRAPDRPEENNITNCASWLEGDHDYAGQVLTQALYVQRPVGWRDMDYSGWAIPGLYPLEELDQVNVGSQTTPVWRLAKRIACGDTNCTSDSAQNDSSCKENDKACGARGVGVCLNGVCLQNPDGTSADPKKNSPADRCRAYPEKDSPFPNTTVIGGAIARFSGARLCNETPGFSSDPAKSYACECDYTKVTYGDDVFVKYWNYQKPNSFDPLAVPNSNAKLPDGICQGGKNAGYACSDDDICRMDDKNPGVCAKKSRTSQFLGWHGFCLEDDISRRLNAEQSLHSCLTWFPVDTVIGSQDVNEQQKTAGYLPPSDLGVAAGKEYCLDANGSGGEAGANMAYPASHYFTGQTLLFGTHREMGGANIQQSNAYGAPGTTCGGTFRDGGVYVGSTNRDTFPPTADESKILLSDVEKIIIQTQDVRDDEDPNGATFEIWPNDPTPVSKAQSVYTTKDHTRTPGIAVTGHYLGKPTEFIYMYASQKGQDKWGQPLDKEGNVCMGDNGGEIAACDASYLYGDKGNCAELSGNIFGVNGQGLLSRLNARTGQQQSGVDMGPEGLWNASFQNGWISDVHAGDGNWNAIRFRFAPEQDPGKQFFQGYDVMYHGSYDFGDEHYIKYKIIFKLRQICKRVAEVDPTDYTSESRAIPWANRLWKQSKYTISTGSSNDFGLIGLLYNYDTPIGPFGSLGLSTMDPSRAVIMTPFEPKTTATTCFPSAGLAECTYPPTVVKDGVETPSYVPGSPYACNNGPTLNCVSVLANGMQKTAAGVGKTSSEANDSISSIFARVSRVHVFGQNSIYYPQQGTAFVDKTLTGDWLKKPRAPVIFPVGQCGVGSTPNCIEDNRAPGMSVLGYTNGKDVEPRTISFKAILNFFVVADADQLPVRQVNVFWGDGSHSPLVDKIAPNYRGYVQPTCEPISATVKHCQVKELSELSCASNADCQDSNRGGKSGATCLLPTDPNTPVGKCMVLRDLGTVCQDKPGECQPAVSMCAPEKDAQSFGRILDRTCIDKPRSFDHVYFCSVTSVDDQGKPAFHKAGEVDSSGRPYCPASGSYNNGCCVFVPKVQVKDNWGWCNGTCRTGAGGGCLDNKFVVNGSDECDDIRAVTPFSNRIILPAPAPTN